MSNWGFTPVKRAVLGWKWIVGCSPVDQMRSPMRSPILDRGHHVCWLITADVCVFLC